MTAYVRFRAGGREYALDVAHAREIRPASGIVVLPSARSDVVGLLPRAGDEEPIVVVRALGEGENHVVVVETTSQRFGLLVDEVTAVIAVDDADIGPAPRGQDLGMVVGTLRPQRTSRGRVQSRPSRPAGPRGDAGGSDSRSDAGAGAVIFVVDAMVLGEALDR